MPLKSDYVFTHKTGLEALAACHFPMQKPSLAYFCVYHTSQAFPIVDLYGARVFELWEMSDLLD